MDLKQIAGLLLASGRLRPMQQQVCDALLNFVEGERLDPVFQLANTGHRTQSQLAPEAGVPFGVPDDGVARRHQDRGGVDHLSFGVPHRPGQQGVFAKDLSASGKPEEAILAARAPDPNLDAA